MATFALKNPWYAATWEGAVLIIVKASPGFGYAQVFCFSDLSAIFSWSMSATRAASRAQSREALYEMRPMAEMIPKIVMTMRSSMSENASRRVPMGELRMFMGR